MVFKILRALAPTTVRAQPAPWLEPTRDVLGRPFLVMDRVPGDVYEMKAPDAEPACVRRMCEGIADQLAPIHLVDLEAVRLTSLDYGTRHLERELNAYKMAVICPIGSMLYADGTRTDERFVLNASGIPLLTQLGLSDLGITEKPEDGPVPPS